MMFETEVTFLSKEPGRFINPVWIEADDTTRNEAASRSEFLKELNKGRKEKKE